MGQAPKVEDVAETVVLEAKNGNVTLSHQKHAKTIDCSTCHQGTPGKIADFGKDKAHALCIGCHKEKNAGPTKCSECHKKS
ncbi:MAG: cytochrome c3 family protein [Desulfuromonadales bacterium]|nr:cytochrome c3 family protein [Desulfuromonadales bacterium]